MQRRAEFCNEVALVHPLGKDRLLACLQELFLPIARDREDASDQIEVFFLERMKVGQGPDPTSLKDKEAFRVELA